MHTPTPEMGWHVALPGQPPEPVVPGVQMRAQYVGLGLPFTSSAHSACAVVPAGGAGQVPEAEHGGEQKAPETPCT